MKCEVYNILKLPVAFIIPARGGSKGIPGKNIKQFNGKPLIQWTIEACKNTKLGPVYVSSDSEDILDVAWDNGAICIKRPVELSGDKASSEDAIIHSLNTMSSLPRTTFFMQCTSPWITSSDILGAYDKLIKSNCDSLIFAKHNHNYFGELLPYFNLYHPQSMRRLMRQDMENRVIEVGAYAFNTKKFLEEKNRQCGAITAYVIDRELPPEIDSPLDWEINEKYFDIWRGVKEYEKNNKTN